MEISVIYPEERLQIASNVLFPEMRASSRARAGTHACKFTCAIYGTHKTIVFSLYFAIIIYFLLGETFHRRIFY